MPRKLSPPAANPNPAITLALADPIKQKKIIKIADSLANTQYIGSVRYGVYGCTFKTIREVLNSKP